MMQALSPIQARPEGFVRLLPRPCAGQDARRRQLDELLEQVSDLPWGAILLTPGWTLGPHHDAARPGRAFALYLDSGVRRRQLGTAREVFHKREDAVVWLFSAGLASELLEAVARFRGDSKAVA